MPIYNDLQAMASCQSHYKSLSDPKKWLTKISIDICVVCNAGIQSFVDTFEWNLSAYTM